MTINDFAAIWFGVLCGSVFYMIGYAWLELPMYCRRVGGLTHWRFGRLGGSLYIKVR